MLTHSRSGTVINVLKQVKNISKIVQTISRPGEEGRLQAERLKREGLDVTLIEDHEVNKIIAGVDLCIFGCDQFTDKDFINKVGTDAIKNCASRTNVPVVVLGDSRKKVAHLTPVKVPFETIIMTGGIVLITESAYVST